MSLSLPPQSTSMSIHPLDVYLRIFVGSSLGSPQSTYEGLSPWLNVAFTQLLNVCRIPMCWYDFMCLFDGYSYMELSPQICSPFLPTWCIGPFVTSILSLSRIILEDGVVTKMEFQSETGSVSEEELCTEKVVPV